MENITEANMTVEQIIKELKTSREMVAHYQAQVGDWVNKLEAEIAKAKSAMGGN